MKIQDIQTHLRSLVEVNEPSVDRIVFGKADNHVSKVATCWTPYFKTCKEAVKRGANLLIAHEPTFYDHWDLDGEEKSYTGGSEQAKADYLAQIETKKAWLEENDLTIIRSHDVPDKVDDFGIVYALAKILGFEESDLAHAKPYYRVYNIKPQSAQSAATMIAKQFEALYQPGVAFYGDPDRQVSTVGFGTGCGCNPIQFGDMQADLRIAIDDVIRTWVQAPYAEDSGDPLVVIHHGTSEDHGMAMLCGHLQSTFPDVEFFHIKQGCGYRWITPN